MKGIVLAGGSGTRLYPITKGISKQLIPIYDKPMVYYPVSVLMLAGIREILIISTPADLPGFRRLLGDGSDYLATVFGYWVADPERYGVAEIDSKGNVLSIEEKPKEPKSNYAVTGLYFYPNEVVDVAANVKPSARGELEITSVNQEFLERGKLRLETLGRGFAWLDTGTHDSLAEASTFIEVIEKRQGQKVACLEDIALRSGWITPDQLRETAKPMSKNQYGQWRRGLHREPRRAPLREQVPRVPYRKPGQADLRGQPGQPEGHRAGPELRVRACRHLRLRDGVRNL